MSAEKQNRNEPLPRTAADLAADPSRIQRVREAIRSVVEREYAIVGKFHELLLSFQTIIPDEKQRYEAALQALSTGLNLSRQEIIASVNKQIEELSLIGNGVGELFEDIKAKMDFLKQRIDTPGASASQQTTTQQICPMCGERTIFDQRDNTWKCHSCSYEKETNKEAHSKQKSNTMGSPAPDAQWQKKCPACGGQMNFHAAEERWLCYTCAHEESQKDGAQGLNEEKQEQAPSPRPASAPDFAVPLASMVTNESQRAKKGASSSPGLASGRKRTCPICNKKMDLHELERAWKCFFCGHKIRC